MSMSDTLISFETAKLGKNKYGKIYNKSGTLANYTNGGEGQLRFHKNSKKQIESANCYAANCGRGDCSVENWKLIIKNIKNGLNKKSK